jgi:hypothetical protein
MVIVGDGVAKCSTRIFTLQLLKLISLNKLHISGSLAFAQHIIYPLILPLVTYLNDFERHQMIIWPDWRSSTDYLSNARYILHMYIIVAYTNVFTAIPPRVVP